MDNDSLLPDRVMEALLPRIRLPVPLAVCEPFAVFGLMTRAAPAPVAVMALLMLTLSEAVSVSVVFALHDTLSSTLTLPVPALAPALLSSEIEVVPSSA